MRAAIEGKLSLLIPLRLYRKAMQSHASKASERRQEQDANCVKRPTPHRCILYSKHEAQLRSRLWVEIGTKCLKLANAQALLASKCCGEGTPPSPRRAKAEADRKLVTLIVVLMIILVTMQMTILLVIMIT